MKLSEGKKTVSCMWIFTIKYRPDGSLYKARLVEKGSVRHMADYQETFAPVGKMNLIRILLSLTRNFDRPLHQFDVWNAFLHGDLEEEVHMDIPLRCGNGLSYIQGVQIEEVSIWVQAIASSWILKVHTVND